MLSVILTILKIIGIILLVIFGLILTVALIVLFVPIRYKSDGNFQKTDDGFKDNIRVRITWLLHIVSVSFKLTDTTPEFVIKIFGKKLSVGDADKQSKPKKKQDNVSESKTVNSKPYEAIETEKVMMNDKSSVENADEKEKINLVKADNKKADRQTDKPADESAGKKSLKEKVTDIWNKADEICKKIKNIRDIKDSFVRYLKTDESKTAIREIKHIIIKVLKHLLPQKLWARIKFGFEDPSTTGNVLGIASVFYGIYGDKLQLEPDFENVVLEGEYKLKGRIRVFTLLVAAFRVYRNKWLRKFISFSKKTAKQK